MLIGFANLPKGIMCPALNIFNLKKIQLLQIRYHIYFIILYIVPGPIRQFSSQSSMLSFIQPARFTIKTNIPFTIRERVEICNWEKWMSRVLQSISFGYTHAPYVCCPMIIPCSFCSSFILISVAQRFALRLFLTNAEVVVFLYTQNKMSSDVNDRTTARKAGQSAVKTAAEADE